MDTQASTTRKETLLPCGWRPSDHDTTGYCTDCESCGQGMCPGDGSDASLLKADGAWHHKKCFAAAERKKFLSSLGEMLLAAQRLQSAGEPLDDGGAAENVEENISYVLGWLQKWCAKNSPARALASGTLAPWRGALNERLGVR